MRKLVFLAALCVFVFSQPLFSEIREPVWDGIFYPNDPLHLSRQITALLQNTPKKDCLPGVKAIIVPHAGYVYSGSVAALGYNQVKDQRYETIVILSPSHKHGFSGCSIFLEGGYKTPLGIASVDENLARTLASVSGFGQIAAAHKEEHAVEVQIPFIQTVFPKAKIVPIVMGFPKKKTISTLAQALAEAAAIKEFLVVASTDMSHFFQKAEASRIDARTISLIESFKTSLLMEKLARGENIMCGGGPVVCALLYVEKLGKGTVHRLGYADSSEAGGDPGRVVGYYSAAVTVSDKAQSFSLNQNDKDELLKIANNAISDYVRNIPIQPSIPENPILYTKRGAFVTLKKKGKLRGCIGYIYPSQPLYKTIQEAAIFAASKDSRFPPVTENELDHLEIEISVLSPLTKISSPRSIIIGKHGLLIIKGNRSGLLLPQVAEENHWSKKEFLCQTCIKAGLPREAWQKDAEIYAFEAIVFH